ncbi:transposase [Streptomyces sp. NPDC097727]|uniref:transposase n=1 Tax=Streptomyces sp. NPDC097727 TaxID=3366092 RepID=UPI003806A82D
MPAPRKYPDGLRERAVREVQASGRPVARVAKDLGIHKEASRGGFTRPRRSTVPSRLRNSGQLGLPGECRQFRDVTRVWPG